MSTKVGARLQEKNRSTELVVNDDNNPFPPIDALEKLHRFRPDLVDQAIQVATEETKHRQEMERKAFEFSVKENIARRRMVTLIAIAALVITAFLGYLGKEMSAVASCLVAVALLISNLFKR